MNRTHFDERCPFSEYNIANYSTFNKYLICFIIPISDIFRIYIIPFFLLSGIFGNIISIKIFLNSEPTSSSRIYYLSLSIVDLLNLISYSLPLWIGQGLQQFSGRKVYFYLDEMSAVFCYLVRYGWLTTWFISYWLVTAFSFERFLAIKFPFFRNQYLTVANSKKVCATITILGLVLFTPIFTGQIFIEKCGLFVFQELDWRVFWFGIICIGCMVILPPIFLTVSNTFLIAVLVELGKSRQSIINNSSINERSIKEINNAKLLLWLSLITVVFSYPTMSWVLYMTLSGGKKNYFLFI